MAEWADFNIAPDVVEVSAGLNVILNVNRQRLDG